MMQILGIIPACAGSTGRCGGSSAARRDHPRMCGEHARFEACWVKLEGSSPHVRGAQPCIARLRLLSGIIPACAGSTHYVLVLFPNLRDHPRMCGEHGGWTRRRTISNGSSPHVRGALRRTTTISIPRGIIPACAGSTQRSRRYRQPCRDHPRMCGEHASTGRNLHVRSGSSPHVRGALEFPHHPQTGRGIIPACAGSTGEKTGDHVAHRDHPRMCGEHRRSAGSLSP